MTHRMSIFLCTFSLFFFIFFSLLQMKQALFNELTIALIELGAIWRIPWIARMVKLEILEMEKRRRIAFFIILCRSCTIKYFSFFLFFFHYYIWFFFFIVIIIFFYIFLLIIISDIMHERNYSFKICNETLTHCVQYFLIVWFYKMIIILADKDKN